MLKYKTKKQQRHAYEKKKQQILHLELSMLLEQIHSVKFVRILTMKELDKEYVRLCRWKDEQRFEQQSIRQLLYLVVTTQAQQFAKRL
jgi:hypothetical protein